MKNGKLSFVVGDKHVEFNLFKALKVSSIFNECHRIDVINPLVWKTITNQVSIDPLEHCMLNDGTTKDDNHKVAMFAQLLEAFPQIRLALAKVEALISDDKSLCNEKCALEVELKPLSLSLRNKLLGPNSTYPVIINAN